MASDSWTEAKCFKLIRAFRKRPVLWDKKDVFFYKRDIKQSAWLEIGEELQTDAEECRRKMYILMSSFRREKAKIMNNSTETSTVLSSWFGYSEMSFLLDKDGARRQSFTTTDDEDDDNKAQHVIDKQINLKRHSSEMDEQGTSLRIKTRRLGESDDEEYANEQQNPEPPEIWTEAKSLQLIREFRGRTLLWDRKNPLYYKKPMKQAAWMEISEVLHSSADNCKRKMSILMSSFRREKAKIVNSMKQGNDSAGAINSYWFAFKAMSFMLDKDSERERHAMGIIDIDIEDTPPPVFHFNVKNIKSLKAPPDENNDENTRKRRPLSEADNQDSDASSPEQQLLPTPSQHNEDEMKYFTKFIISKMMKYSEATKNVVQQKICEIIFKADQNYYEPTQGHRGGPNDPLNPIHQALSTNRSTNIKIRYSDSE